MLSGAGSQFRKSEWFISQQGTRKFDLFAERDIIIHRNNRRLVNNAYATTSLMELELYMSSATSHFMSALAQRQGQRLDLGVWLQLFAFGTSDVVSSGVRNEIANQCDIDVIGEVTFSQRFGLMDTGVESETILQIKRFLGCQSWVGQIPWVFKIHQRLSPYFGNWLAVTARNGSLREYAVQQVQSRILRGSDHRDMLSRFIEINKVKPKEFDEAALISMVASNIAAGSDTTAISLRAMMYHLLMNPQCLEKLVAEVDEATQGLPRDAIVSYEIASKMPYLQAVMTEAMRIHPLVGSTMQRVVPHEGIQIGQHYIPAGVPCSPSDIVPPSY